MAQDHYGVRKYLTDRGVNNADITYDPNRQMVMVGGKDFLNATPEADGSTYGSQSDLNRAMSSYDQIQRKSQLEPLVNLITQKAQSPTFRYYAPKPFAYDPNSDPLYQSAVGQAQRGAQSASNNAMVQLGSRGIGNSSITANNVAQIQQRAYGDVIDKVLPQLANQAYQQYNDQANRDYQAQRDNYLATQDQYKNLASLVPLISGLGQQELDNQFRADQAAAQNRQSNIDLAKYLTSTYGVNAVPKSDAGVAFDQVAGQTPLNMQQFQQGKAVQDAGLTGDFNGSPTLQRLAQEFTQGLQNKQFSSQQANTAADNARANEQLANSKNNAETNRLMEIWRATGLAPAGIPGVKEGTPLYDQVGSRNQGNTEKPTDYKTNPQFADDINYLLSNPDQADKLLANNASEFIKAYGYDGYRALKAELDDYKKRQLTADVGG